MAKDELDPNQQEAVKKVYEVFSGILESEAQADELEEIVTARVKRLVEDPRLRALCVEVVNIYWAKLESDFNLKELVGEERAAVLKEFNEGVRKALDTYGE